MNKQVFFLVLVLIAVGWLSSCNHRYVDDSCDSDIEHDLDVATQKFSESIPLDLRFPSLSCAVANSAPILVLSCHEYLRENHVVYILCIWSDGTVLWNPSVLEWCLATHKHKTLHEVPVKYFWKKIDKGMIKQLSTSISHGTPVMRYAMPVGVLTLFDIYFISNEKMDFMRVGFFPTTENRFFFGFTPEIFDRASLIVEESLKMIPISGFQQIDNNHIQTLTKRVYIPCSVDSTSRSMRGRAE